MARRRREHERPRLIAIEGPIGVGKTTLAQHLAKRLNARPVFEDVESNPFLQEFYADPGRYAFQAQMFFLLSRYQQQQALRQEELFFRATVADYVFQKDRIFAYLNLNPPELALYERVYQLLDARIPVPDLVVYLQARSEVLLERIRSRNRDWERPIVLDYLERVSKAYAEFFFHYDRSPLLVINTSDIDFVEKEAHLEEVISAIRRMKRGVQHYNPFTTR
jgi:deoxyadenosine/deoxycytidine kinase